MLNRRELAAVIAGVALAPGATLAPGAAGAAEPEAPSEAKRAFDEAMKLAFASKREEGRYLTAWPRIAPHIDIANGGSDRQWAAFLGDEATALADASKGQMGPVGTPARTEDAIEAIVSRAKGRRVVMLNEAHVASRDRLFMARVMAALYREGFTHLACEAFTNARSYGGPSVETLVAGSALQPDHGHYLADPVFAEAVREALQLGYLLMPYEQIPTPADMALPMETRIVGRETGEAANLAKALSDTPGSRFLIYVGYDHLAKTSLPHTGLWMAGRLKATTGIDALTIQQDCIGSFAPHGPDNATAQAILAAFKPKDSVAVFGPNGAALASERRGCDLTIFHPPRPDVEGRPGWLAAAQGRRRVSVRLPGPAPGGYVLAQAVPATDPDPAIPADQYLLAQGAREAVFHLRPGRYRVRLETPEGFTAVGEVKA